MNRYIYLPKIFSWKILECIPNLDVDDILEVTMYNGKTVEDLVEYLDGKRFPGILKKWAGQYIAEAIAFLKEVLVFDEKTEAILKDARSYFNIQNEEQARSLIVDYFYKNINQKSPEYLKRAMIAYIEFSLGNFVKATTETGFAVNEKEITNFGIRLISRPMDDETQQSLLRVERKKAELLVNLIKEFGNL